jgi:hypothetical protein
VFKRLKRYLNQRFIKKTISYQTKIIGIILVCIGIIFFYNPTNINIKIGTMLVLIGGIFFFLILNNQDYYRFECAEIIFIFILWILFLFIITGNSPPETYFFLIAIGITAIRELTNELISPNFKKNLNIFLLLIFIIFLLIVIQKIISVFRI